MQYAGGSHTVVRGFGVMVSVAAEVDVTVAEPDLETITLVEVRVMGILNVRSMKPYIGRFSESPGGLAPRDSRGRWRWTVERDDDGHELLRGIDALHCLKAGRRRG